jgi:serine/threonine protein kinase
MTHKQWLQVTRIFADAIEVDGEKRDQWLDDACGDDNELYKEVQSLLKAYTSPGLPDLSLKEVRQSAVSWMELQDKKGRQIGPYQLQEMIGRGGMGVVYRAYDCRLDRDVAIKFPPPYWSLNEQTKKRFLNEARIAASLDHPNICTIYEADELDDGTLFMAMAFYQGETLQQRLEQGPLDLDDAVDLIIQTASGLEAAHKKGLIHRDIKPANLILTQNGTLKVLDFGIAMAADEGITFSEQQPGTEAYMSPEQVHGGRVDKRTDLWSMGVIFYEMLTGELPRNEWVSVSSLHPGVPARIDELLCQLLDPDPDNRMQSAGELVATLKLWMDSLRQ